MKALSKREKLIALLAPILLLVVAVTQMTAAHTTTLSSWKGGGFGMFATIDNQGTRYLEMSAVTPDGEEYDLYVPFSADEIRHYRNFIELPTDYTENLFLSSLETSEWVVIDESNLEDLESDDVYLSYLPEDDRILPRAGVTNIKGMEWEDLEVLRNDTTYRFNELEVTGIAVLTVDYDPDTTDVEIIELYNSSDNS